MGIRGLVALAVIACAAVAGDNLAERWDKVKRVTIKAKGITVAAAAKRISKATGYTVNVSGKRDYRMDLELVHATFFQALDDVALRAGLALQVSQGRFSARQASMVVGLVERDKEMRHVSAVNVGPLRLAVLGVYASRSAARRFSPLASKPDDTPQKLWLEMRAMMEPRFDGAHLMAAHLEFAQDDASRSLVGKTTKFDGLAFNDTFRLELKPAGRGSLKIAELRGKLDVVLPTKIVELKYGPGSRKSTKTLGGAKFTFHRLKRKGEDGRPELVVSLKGTVCDELGGDEWDIEVATDRWSGYRADPGDVAIYLYDRDGNEIGTRGTRRIRDMLEGKSGTRFNLDAVPARILVRATTEVKRKEITFRFTDLPIPR